MTEKIATRESYGQVLVELGASTKNLVVLDADLTGATKTRLFQKAYPERHINCGIAESNMMVVAAGLAAEGMIPVVSTFAMFAAGRAWEQIRNSIAYPRLNVKIGATHGGISVGEDGASHQCCEDIALMRAIPGMTVICPSDDREARAALAAVVAYEGPVYLRFSRMAAPVFHAGDYQFQWGRAEALRAGRDVTLIATGICVAESLRAAELLRKNGIDAGVVNVHTIKPLDGEAILAAAETGRVVTVEEHSVIGGLGSAVCDLLSERRPTPVLKIGIQDVFGQSGSAAALLERYGLTAERIAGRILDWMR